MVWKGLILHKKKSEIDPPAMVWPLQGAEASSVRSAEWLLSTVESDFIWNLVDLKSKQDLVDLSPILETI